MDFADIGARANYRHIDDTFRASRRLFPRGGNREEITADKVREAMMPNRLIFVGATGSLTIAKIRCSLDPPLWFCAERNIKLQTVIPGRHHILGATELRHLLFMGITEQLVEEKKASSISNIDCESCGAMCTFHLNTQMGFGGICLVYTWSKSLR